MKDFNIIPEIVKNIQYMNNHAVEVGVMGGGEIQMIAAVNEYGARIKVTEKSRKALHGMGLHLKKTTDYITIPERSFFRSTLSDDSTMSKAIDRISPALIGQIDGRTALDLMGASVKGAIQNKIKSNIKPANHPFTVKKKRSRKTLANKGQLSGSIDYQVV